MALYGLGPPVSKLITAPPLVVTALRSCLGAPLLWAVVYAGGGRLRWRTVRRTAVPGLLFAANSVFVLGALRHSSVAVMTVIQALQPAVVLLVGWRWLGERLTLRQAVLMVVGTGGVVLAVLGGNPEVRGSVLGVLLALASMSSFTGYYLFNRHLRATTEIGPIEFLAGGSVAAAVVALAASLATEPLAAFSRISGADWGWIVFMTVGLGLVGHGTMSWLHRYVTAGRSSMVLIGSNAIAILVAWPVHHEPVTLLQAVGSGIALVAAGAVLRAAALSVDVIEST